MKKALLVGVSLAALGSAPAFAADLAARQMYTKAPVAEPIYNWGGFYLGAMGGYAHENASSAAMEGGFAGGTVGYNWQVGNTVFGIETDAAWADISATTTTLGVSANSKIRDLGTVRGRIGYAFGATLLYGTGGYAWADNRISISSGALSVSDSQLHSGWTVGAGVEYMFAPHWSLKGEYLYKSFGSQTYTFAGLGAVPSGTLNIHSGQFGINYHF